MRRMYRHKFAHFCGCFQEHFVLPKFGQELSMDKTSIKSKRTTGYIKNFIQGYSLVKRAMEKLTLF